MYAVIDTETTGLNPYQDRVIELAIIALDRFGEKEWEWCTLVNPERDTGGGLAVRVHQIYPSDVADVPTFSDFAGHISECLDGRTLIAHNARFDYGMLAAEFGRLGVGAPDCSQICTADLARDLGLQPWGLEDCCDALGIEREGAHHALADARATWFLARELLDFRRIRADTRRIDQNRGPNAWPMVPVVQREPLMRPILPCRKRRRKGSWGPRESRKDSRDMSSKGSVTVVEAPAVVRDGPTSRYLAAIEWVIEDRAISPEQKEALDKLQWELRLTEQQVRDVHLTFLRGLAGSMWDDGKISSHEQYDIETVGDALGLSKKDVNDALQSPISLELTNEDYRLELGARVVFTGEMEIPRSEWTERAKMAGLRVTGSVSGKTDFLVVPFGETGSSKSRNARKLGVRVITEQRFVRMIRELETS